MAAIDDDEEFDPTPPSDEEIEAELQRQMAHVPPELYEALRPLLLLAGLANYMLLGHDEDPVPVALKQLLDYDFTAAKIVSDAQDTPSLARVMAANTLQLFDFTLIGRLVFESRLEAHLLNYIAQRTPPDEGFADPRGYLVTHTEGLLENLGIYLTGDDDDLREELRLRRLQTESIFARLDDTLRFFYLPGQSPEDLLAAAQDEEDEAADADDPVAYLTFNEGQRLALATALRLPPMLTSLSETPFARALTGVRRLRDPALARLAARFSEADLDEQLGLTWSELLRLYQAVQVCALSTVADVLATGSLEDNMVASAEAEDKSPEEAAVFARTTRRLMLLVMQGFVNTIETNYPDNEDVLAAKAEISELAELLAD